MTRAPNNRPFFWVLLLAAATATFALACDDDESKPVDAGDVAADESDAADVPSDLAPGDLSIGYVFSQDGTEVGVVFSESINADTATNPDNYWLVASDDSELSVTSAVVTDTYVVLTPEEPLDASMTWDLYVERVTDTDGETFATSPFEAPVMATVFLNLIWHQHQPSYLDPELDQLQGPWVRKHATKDYFDMTSILRDYPNVHFNVNLTSSLLNQLDLYIDRLGPYVDLDDNSIDEAAFLAEFEGRTDPWIDLLLNDTPAFNDLTEEERGYYFADVWSTRTISSNLRAFFPEYEELYGTSGGDLTQVDLLHLKLYFEIAWMDPDFLNGPVVVYVDDGGEDVVVDLSDVVVRHDDPADCLAEEQTPCYTLNPYYTTDAANDAERIERGEALANRLVVENYKCMVGSFKIHEELLYDGTGGEAVGQIDVLTTPFYHPILPLLWDTDLASEGQPTAPLPSPSFSFPGDVDVQVATAVEYYTRTFGQPPRGMWPSEGAVAEEIIHVFRDHQIDWIATDRQVLERSLEGASHHLPYMIDSDTEGGHDGDHDDEMMIVFRDTELADKISFNYKGGEPADNALDFMTEVLSAAGRFGEPEVLLTVIADGENAWEHFIVDHDAKGFFHALYTSLEQAHSLGTVVTVNGTEYIDGNADRGVSAHPISDMVELEDLFPGSWIFGILDTWIGETEENLGWTYLRTAREDLDAADALVDIALGSLLDEPDGTDVAELAWWRAWHAMFAAEGSDWFWWYGSDQTSAGNADPRFDELFRGQLVAMYTFMNEALVAEGEEPFDVPGFPPVIQEPPVPMDGPFVTAPTLNGVLSPDDSEWLPPGGSFYDNDTAGVEPDPDDDIDRVLFGFKTVGTGDSEETIVYVGIELNEDLEAKLNSDYQLVIYTNHQNIIEGDSGIEVEADPMNTETEEGVPADFRAGGTARQILFDFSGATVAVSLADADGSNNWTPVTTHAIAFGGPTAQGKLLEIGIPMEDLGMSFGDPFEFMVVAVEGGDAIDIAPNIGTQVLFYDPTTLVTVIMELDATGDVIPLEEFVTIQNPPPPNGTGQVSIAGHQDEFGNWTPNSVFLSDDGEAPDTAAGDNIWTRAFIFPPGTFLQYKFTIGLPEDSGDWGCCEEYPLTNRGYSVPTDGTRRLRLRDIFADRPDPSGSLAPNAVVTVEE